MLTNTLGVQYDANGNTVSGDTGATIPTGAVFIGGVNGGNLVGVAVSATGAILTQSSAADTTATGNLNALNANVTVQTAGQTSVGFQLAAGTLVGTIVPEVSYDDGVGGTTWEQTYFFDPVTGLINASIVFGVANTAQAKSIYVPPGAGAARVRVSAFTSGTAVATIRASTVGGQVNLAMGPSGSAAPPFTVQMGGLNAGNLIATAVDASGRTIAVGAAASGAAVAGNPVLSGGSDGANARTMLTDASGRQIMVGAAASGAAAAGNPVEVGGVTSGGNAQAFLVDTQGRLLVIEEKAGTAAITRVATSNASASLLVANANRLGATIVNDSGHKLYIKFGATASTTSYTVLVPAAGYYEVPFDYTGAIDGILDSGTGNAQITELTN